LKRVLLPTFGRPTIATRLISYLFLILLFAPFYNSDRCSRARRAPAAPAVRRCYGPGSFDAPGFTEALERCARILLGSLELKEVEP